nr:SMI1/KNR4 family protein [Sphingomonas sp.]
MAVRTELIERLRERLKNPSRRTDRRISVSRYELQSATDEELRAGRQSAADDLNALIDARRRGEPPPRNLREKAAAALARMKSPAPGQDPVPASSKAIGDAGRRLGFPLPEDLTTIHTEVADGGFGPGYGLLSIAGVVRIFERLRSYDLAPPWPEEMLPITDDDGVLHCIDRTGGTIMRFDPERLNDDNNNIPEALQEVAPSLESWLDRWLKGPTEEEIGSFEAAREKAFAEARERWRQRVEAYIEQLREQSAKERAKLGLGGANWEEKLRRDLLGQ